MTDTTAKNGTRLNGWALVWSFTGIAVIVLCVWWGKKNFEWQEVEENKGYSAEAIEHKLLAAKRYLQARDYRIEEISGLDFYSNLPTANSAILLRQLPSDLPSTQYENLSAWVKNGGHLIAGLDLDSLLEEGDEDHFLFRLLAGDTAVVRFLEDFGITTRAINLLGESEYQSLWPLVYPGDSESTMIEMRPTVGLTVSNQYQKNLAVHAEDLYYFIQLKAGSGYLTLTTHRDLFSNANIGRHDNALLLSRTLETTDVSTIWFNDTRMSYKGIFTLIWEQFKWLVLVLATLLAFSLRRASVRLGPLEKQSDNLSSNFSRHLLAMERFQFKHGDKSKVLEATREKIIKASRGNSPKTDTEVVTSLAERTKMDRAQLSSALFGEVTSSAALINTSKVLQTILARLDSR